MIWPEATDALSEAPTTVKTAIAMRQRDRLPTPPGTPIDWIASLFQKFMAKAYPIFMMLGNLFLVTE
jgi:hypothetical protein